MSVSLNWMPLYVRDYDEDTEHLTCEQDGAYGRLLRKMWLRGDLPNDDSALARICGVTRTHWVRHLKPAIIPLLFVTEIGTLSQKRLEKERKNAWKISEKRAENARKKSQNTVVVPRENNDIVRAKAPANEGTNGEHLLVHPHKKEEEKKERKKEAEPQPPVATADKSAVVDFPFVDVRAQLFTEGVSRLRSLTGNTEPQVRAMLGKLCKDANDDCARVLEALRQAESVRPVAPFPWLRQALAQPVYDPNRIEGFLRGKTATQRGLAF